MGFFGALGGAFGGATGGFGQGAGWMGRRIGGGALGTLGQLGGGIMPMPPRPPGGIPMGTMESIGRGSKEAFGPMLGGPKPNAPGFAGPLDPSATGFPGGPPIGRGPSNFRTQLPDGWQPGGPPGTLGPQQPFDPSQYPQVPPGWVPPGMSPQEWQRFQDEANDPNLIRAMRGSGYR